MKELTRTQRATIKSINGRVKLLRDKINKINEKIIKFAEKQQIEIMNIEEQIEMLETPVKSLTGGFTSEEYFDGTMDAITEQIEEMSKESHCCDCPIEENVKNEVENTQENVNEVPVETNEIPYI